jgi:hypothetical protein
MLSVLFLSLQEEEHYRLSKRNVLEQAAGSPGRVQNLAKMESSQSILLNSHGGARVAPEVDRRRPSNPNLNPDGEHANTWRDA